MATNLPNRAQITYDGGCGSEPGVVLSNETTTVLVDRYTLAVTKTALLDSVRDGGTAAYVLQLSNTGSGTLYNPAVFDNLGSDTEEKPLSYIDGSAMFYVNGVPSAGGVSLDEDGVTFSSAVPLEQGDSLLVIYAADVDAEECIVNTALATANSGSAEGAEISDTDSAEVCVESCANISVFKTADKDTVVEGDTLTYTFTLMNTGSGEATSIGFVDSLPPQFSVNTVSYTTDSGTSVIPPEDYSITEPNTLTIPAPDSSLVISVPAADSMGPGMVTITVTGTIG